MSRIIEVAVPDIGEFSGVEIIEVHVAAGSQVAAEDPLITLESDKAAMEVPSPAAGTVEDVAVTLGDKVSEGALILRLAVEDVAESGGHADAKATAAAASVETPSEPAIIASGDYDGAVDFETELLVLGSGPGGYTAAFRAADLGIEVTLVERYPDLGGVCLNVGCIPSKALLHAAKVIDEAGEMADCGIQFGPPKIDTAQLRDWKGKVVTRLTGGLTTLAKQRKVKTVHGAGEFVSPHHLKVTDGKKSRVIAFGQCIIAAGSEAAKIPGWPEDPRIVDSTGALELPDLPKRMLVVGGGIIGLEMATVYCALGV